MRLRTMWGHLQATRLQLGMALAAVMAILIAGCSAGESATTTHAATTTAAAATTQAPTTTTVPTVPLVTGTHQVRDLPGPANSVMSPELKAMIGTPFEAGKVTLLTGERHLSDPRLDGLAEVTFLDCGGAPAAGSADQITCAGVSSTWDEDGTWESGVIVHIAEDGSMLWEVSSVGTGAYEGLAWTATERGSGLLFEVSGRVEERPGSGSGLLVEPVGTPPPGATPITPTVRSTYTGIDVGPLMPDPTHEWGSLWESDIQASDPRGSGRQIAVLHANRSGATIPVWGVDLLLVEPGKSWYGPYVMTVTDTFHVVDGVYTGIGEYAGLEYHFHGEGNGHFWDGGWGWIDEAD